jgi:predicted DNA-binding transcriptional regulator AlpA
LIREGKFPAPVNLGGGRAVAWLRREVEAFVRERIEQRAAERQVCSPLDSLQGK